MDKIVSAFEVTLFDSTFSDACVELIELGVDSLLDDGLIRSIPIGNILVGVGKTAQNIHDRNLLRQTIKFVNTFNEKTISLDKLQKYRKRIKDNPKYAEEELGRVLISLNANVELKKSEILARFYRAYVEEKIDWDSFCELSDVTSRLFVSDLNVLFGVKNGQITDTSQCKAYQVDRLIALGLLTSAVKAMTISSSFGSHTERYIQVSQLGKNFCLLCQG